MSLPPKKFLLNPRCLSHPQEAGMGINYPPVISNWFGIKSRKISTVPKYLRKCAFLASGNDCLVLPPHFRTLACRSWPQSYTPSLSRNGDIHGHRSKTRPDGAGDDQQNDYPPVRPEDARAAVPA